MKENIGFFYAEHEGGGQSTSDKACCLSSSTVPHAQCLHPIYDQPNQ